MNPASDRLQGLIRSVTSLVAGPSDESHVLKAGRGLLRDLLRHDDWLPDAFAEADPARYRQYLLYCDPYERFSVVSFVWCPGQATPIHDHRVWGLVGVLRGEEVSQAYRHDAQGKLTPHGAPRRLGPGDVEALSPAGGDIHRVENQGGETAVSIHVYGGNIGTISRTIYDEQGRVRPFVSGFSNDRPMIGGTRT